VEVDVVAEMKDESEGVGLLPTGGEPRAEVVACVFFDESVEDDSAYTLGLGVGALAEVEVVGAALDDHDDDAWVCGVAIASGEQEQGREQERDGSGHP
jgi:hypothetical protein